MECDYRNDSERKSMIARTQHSVTSASSRSPAIVILSIDMCGNPRGLISIIEQPLKCDDHHFPLPAQKNCSNSWHRKTSAQHSSDIELQRLPFSIQFSVHNPAASAHSWPLFCSTSPEEAWRFQHVIFEEPSASQPNKLAYQEMEPICICLLLLSAEPLTSGRVRCHAIAPCNFQ